MSISSEGPVGPPVLLRSGSAAFMRDTGALPPSFAASFRAPAGQAAIARSVLSGMHIGAVPIGACSAEACPPTRSASDPKRRLAVYLNFVSACIGWSPVVDKIRAVSPPLPIERPELVFLVHVHIAASRLLRERHLLLKLLIDLTATKGRDLEAPRPCRPDCLGPATRESVAYSGRAARSPAWSTANRSRERDVLENLCAPMGAPWNSSLDLLRRASSRSKIETYSRC